VDSYLNSFEKLGMSPRHLIKLPPTYTNPEKTEIYSGQWNSLTKLFHGYGIFITKEGGKIEGHWVEGILHGHGRVIYISGDYYEGEIVHGICSGKGNYYYYHSGRYEGDFENDLMHGNGVEYYSEKSSYEGQFQNGKKLEKENLNGRMEVIMKGRYWKMRCMGMENIFGQMEEFIKECLKTICLMEKGIIKLIMEFMKES